VVHEDRLPARLEHAPGLGEHRLRFGVRVERVHVHHLIERRVPERLGPGQVTLTEGEIGQALGPALLPRQLDERAVRLQPEHGEPGLGEDEREIAGAAVDVEDLERAAIGRGRDGRRLDHFQHLGLQPLVGAELLEDVVVHESVADRQHPVDRPLEPALQRTHDHLRRDRAT
jgi:hypothetical protein